MKCLKLRPHGIIFLSNDRFRSFVSELLCHRWLILNKVINRIKNMYIELVDRDEPT